jgi:hypothetical protein
LIAKIAKAAERISERSFGSLVINSAIRD